MALAKAVFHIDRENDNFSSIKVYCYVFIYILHMGGLRGEVEERAATPLSMTLFLNKDFLVKEIVSI